MHHRPHKNQLQVFKNYSKILQGYRNKHDGLWDIPLSPTNNKTTPLQVNKANIIIHKNHQIKDLMQYLHAALFSPSKRTLLRAIANGNFIGWPNFTVQNVKKYLEETTHTAKGHLKQHRQNLQSTKEANMIHDDHFPVETKTVTNECIAAIIDYAQTKKGFFDLIGQFPFPSSRGNNYIFILYDQDSNAILATTLKSRTAGDITKAWNKLHDRLKRRGIQPTTYIMDNEASHSFKQAILKIK